MSMEGLGEHAPDIGNTPLPPGALIGRRWSVSRPTAGLGSVLLMRQRAGVSGSGDAEDEGKASPGPAPAAEPR